MFLGHAIITGDSNQTLDNRDLDMMREKNHSITLVHCLVQRYHPGSIDALMFLVKVNYDDKLLFLAFQRSDTGNSNAERVLVEITIVFSYVIPLLFAILNLP